MRMTMNIRQILTRSQLMKRKFIPKVQIGWLQTICKKNTYRRIYRKWQTPNGLKRGKKILNIISNNFIHRNTIVI